MASREAIAKGLAFLHELFPTRALTERTGEAWSQVFQAVGDDAFLGACMAASREPGRTFFPTPGELWEFLRPIEALPDATTVLRQIEKMSVYNPASGMIPPRVQDVRVALGDAAADAYGYAGPTRLFSDDETARDIAMRDFATTLQRGQREHRPLLPGVASQRQLAGQTT